MNKNDLQSVVVYSSPAGSTRHVAKIIAEALKEEGCKLKLIDFEDKKDCDATISTAKDDLVKRHCLWIGSPVYAWHASPIIERFISQLPEGKGSYAVPFVTWGASSSGIALPEMGQMLAKKGYSILGAAKIVAVHSVMMCWSDQPLGKGHPDARDDNMIRELVKIVTSGLQQSDPTLLPVDELNYQPTDFQQKAQEMSIDVAKESLLKLEVNTDLCNQCGVCSEECPVQAIDLDPFPRLRWSDCIYCHNCVRLCPEGAFKTDFLEIESRAQDYKEEFSERPLSQIFI